MKIEIQQLSQAKKTAIADCLRKIGGHRNDAGSYYNYWYLEIAREIEHGDLLLARYNYPQQEKEEKP